MMFLSDLVLDGLEIDWSAHLPLMLHVIFLGKSEIQCWSETATCDVPWFAQHILVALFITHVLFSRVGPHESHGV